MTIENLTTFFRWNEPATLMVYLGGYHNTIRRRLLQKIYRAFPQAEYRHFGDMDAGGFEIYRDLREKTGIPFEPYRMDTETLNEYRSFARPLTDNDRKRLQKMIAGRDGRAGDSEVSGEGGDAGAFAEFSELISHMLRGNIKLEQECIAPRQEK